MVLSLLIEVQLPVFLNLWHKVEVDGWYNVPVPKDTFTGTHWKERLPSVIKPNSQFIQNTPCSIMTKLRGSRQTVS
jgi:hypothetical protein